MPSGLMDIGAADRYERRACAHVTVLRAQTRGERVAWIVPSDDMACALKRRLADTRQALLGVEITTLDGWARGRWALYGDGRKPVSAIQRRILVKKALNSGSWACASLASAGMAQCIADIVRTGAGLAAFEAGAAAEGLTAAQQELMDACRTYFALLDGRNLIEPGSMMHELVRAMPEAGWQHLVLDGCWNLEGSAVELVGAAAGHAGVTLLHSGTNAARKAEAAACELVRGAAHAHGAQVASLAGAEFLSQAEKSGAGPSVSDLAGLHRPARAPELAALAHALFGEDPRGTACVTATGAVRACLPAGRYAQGTLLARQIGQLVEQDGIAPRDIAVVARNPLELAESLAGPLSEHAPRGIALSVSGTEKVARSHAGAFVLGWMRLLEAAQADACAPAPEMRVLASDLARNPYMRVPQAAAFKLDRDWRRKRTTGAGTYVSDLAEQLDTQAMDREAEGGGAQAPAGPASPSCPKDLAWVLGLLASRMPQPLTPDDAFERACATRITRAVEEWRALMGADPHAGDLEWLLGTLSAPLGWVSVPASDIAAQRQARVLQASPNAVRVVRPEEVDALEARVVVLCDLTADDYPLRERVDVRSSLWQALGIAEGAGQIAQLRRTFYAAIEAAGDVVVVERPLADEEAKALRPCALLEELVDCYREDPTSTDDLDRTTGLPASGAIPCMGLGEEAFAQLASPVIYAPAMIACKPATFELADPALADLLAKPDALWSPSSLEALINCPMRWLHERKLPSDGLDVPFGDPRSRGTFCHLVLERFHNLLGQRTGIARITADTPHEVWEGVFDESFQYACDAQPKEERPLIPVTELERARLRGYRQELVRCLERERFMPEGFVPAHTEWEFGGAGQTPVMLGGVPIHGFIDRIDVNEEKRAALVVDYKGGLQAGHGPVQPKRGMDEEAACALDPLPRHSQIVMYMAALRQMRPDLALAGGLYISYKKPACAGFVDMRQVGLVTDDKTAYLQRKYCVPLDGPDGTPGIEVVMARVDEAVRQAVAPLREGRVEARPRFGKDSCGFCPLAGSCPKEAR